MKKIRTLLLTLLMAAALLLGTTGCTAKSSSSENPAEPVSSAPRTAPETVEVEAEYQASYDTLMKAASFSFAAVSADGSMSAETKAFKQLYNSKKAVDYFLVLEQKATNAGKLYALCGLYFQDYGTYMDHIQDYASYTETAKVYEKTTASDIPMNQLITEQFGQGQIPGYLMNYIEQQPD